jgi:hypothetical protein
MVEMAYTRENELKNPVNLCTDQGLLNDAARGFSKTPYHLCNLSGHFLRKKKWNYWCITNPDFLFSITISNIDYMGMVFAYFLDLKTKEFFEQTVSTPFGSGCAMSDTVSGRLVFKNAKMSVEFDDNGDAVSLLVLSPSFGGKPLEAAFEITRPANHETLNVVVPWSKDRFQFTSKQTCLPATGQVRMGEKEIKFSSENSYACLDFGRGVWKYESVWNWSSFAGKSGGHTIGVNLGGKWTDGTGFTENGLIIDGRLAKISSDITFDYENQNYMKPWKIYTREIPAVDLVFTPLFERVAKTDLGVLRSEVHQMIGHFNGELVDENGQRYEVKDLVGWAEDHAARW